MKPKCLILIEFSEFKINIISSILCKRESKQWPIKIVEIKIDKHVREFKITQCIDIDVGAMNKDEWWKLIKIIYIYLILFNFSGNNFPLLE